jgi:hypothetical protein
MIPASHLFWQGSVFQQGDEALFSNGWPNAASRELLCKEREEMSRIIRASRSLRYWMMEKREEGREKDSAKEYAPKQAWAYSAERFYPCSR